MYKVLNSFREISHKDHVYKAGDIYPANGFDADPKRVEFLQSTHCEYKMKFLEETSKNGSSEKDNIQDEPTVKELKEEAKKLKIEGYSSMLKDELIEAIGKATKDKKGDA